MALQIIKEDRVLKRVNKPETIRELGTVDIANLEAAVARLSEKAWMREDSIKENAFECFHSTRHFVLRFITGNADPRVFTSYPAWQVWQPLMRPIFEHATRDYGFAAPEYPKVMLARLEAGGVIDRHSDGAGSHPFTHKIHVPLQTNEQTHLEVGGNPYHLRKGTAYEVNNIKLHSAENRGKEDRIHLIFEVFDTAQAGASIASEIA